MATSKKTIKKAAPKTTTKAASAKKAAVQKPVSKKTSKQKAQMKSFRISPEEQAFMDVQVTRQTVYWIILISFIIFVQLWILQLHIEVAAILDAQQLQLLNP